MEFVLQSPNKFGEPRAKPGDADGLNGLLPGVLIISGHRKNFFKKHLRSEARALRRELGATIAA